MNNYNFGAGGLKLGDRVEVMTTRQRGILIREIIHISGCNTYQVLLPNVTDKEEGGMKVRNYDYLLLRRLESNEAVFGKEDNLMEDNVFAPKGTDVNAEWIMSSVHEDKEPIPEIDEAIGVEEISIQPGMEVWHKVYNLPMLVSYIYRDVYSKELKYGLTYMLKEKEIVVSARAYAMIPIEQRINIYANVENKTGPLFEDSHYDIDDDFLGESFDRYGGDM